MVQAADLGPTFSVCISMSSTSGPMVAKGASEQRRSGTSVPEHVGLAVNDTSYRYEEGKNDELGFKTLPSS